MSVLHILKKITIINYLLEKYFYSILIQQQKQYSSDGVPLLNFSLFSPFEELQRLDLSKNYFDGLYNHNGIYFTFPSKGLMSKWLSIFKNIIKKCFAWQFTKITIVSNAGSDGFGSLQKLKILNLGNNLFNETILSYLTSLTSLKTLILNSINIGQIRARYIFQIL